MATYVIEPWGDFFIASAGAAAALAGLVFIGISINLTRILGVRGLSGRAAETIVVLANTLAVCLVALVPGESHVWRGIALLAVAATGWSATIAIQTRTPMAQQYRRYHWTRVVFAEIATLPLVIGAASLIAARGGGFYWIAAGVVLSLMVAISNAWVLLVEILR